MELSFRYRLHNIKSYEAISKKNKNNYHAKRIIKITNSSAKFYVNGIRAVLPPKNSVCRMIWQCRHGEKVFAYTDKTWLWRGTGRRKNRLISENSYDSFSEAVPSPSPTSRGRKLVVLRHVTSEGLPREGEKASVLKQRKKNGDYHRDMCFKVYKTWSTWLIEKMRYAYGIKRVFLALDNTLYHSKRLIWIPTSAYIVFDATWTNSLLLQVLWHHIAGKEEEF